MVEAGPRCPLSRPHRGTPAPAVLSAHIPPPHSERRSRCRQTEWNSPCRVPPPPHERLTRPFLSEYLYEAVCPRHSSPARGKRRAVAGGGSREEGGSS